MMKQLLIIGARGFGREVHGLAQKAIGYGTEFKIKGFLDDKSDALDGYTGYSPIIGPVEEYNVCPNDVFICALGSPKYRKKYAEIIINKGGEFINIISPLAIISPKCSIGVGNVICSYAIISADVKMDGFSVMHNFVTIGHDSTLGKYCELECRTFIGGGAKISDLVTIHTGAVIHPHIQVEEDVVVGANSVVIRKVKKGQTVFGLPAKVLKF